MSVILSPCENTQICLLLQSGGGNSRLISQRFGPMQNIIGYKAPDLRNRTKLVHKTVLAGKINLPVSRLRSSHSVPPLTSNGAHPRVIWQQLEVSLVSHWDAIKHIQAWGRYNQ